MMLLASIPSFEDEKKNGEDNVEEITDFDEIKSLL